MKMTCELNNCDVMDVPIVSNYQDNLKKTLLAKLDSELTQYRRWLNDFIICGCDDIQAYIKRTISSYYCFDLNLVESLEYIENEYQKNVSGNPKLDLTQCTHSESSQCECDNPCIYGTSEMYNTRDLTYIANRLVNLLNMEVCGSCADCGTINQLIIDLADYQRCFNSYFACRLKAFYNWSQSSSSKTLGLSKIDISGCTYDRNCKTYKGLDALTQVLGAYNDMMEYQQGCMGCTLESMRASLIRIFDMQMEVFDVMLCIFQLIIDWSEENANRELYDLKQYLATQEVQGIIVQRLDPPNK